MAWQLDLLRWLERQSASQAQVAELWVLGSAREPESLDEWSDLDLGLVLTAPVSLGTLIGSEQTIWAMDRSHNERRSTLRIVLTDGRRLDLVVADHDEFDSAGGLCLRSTTGPSHRTEESLIVAQPTTDAEANEARFIAAQALVKHGRGDLLIAAHLCLELAQLCLVQAMLLRDRDEGATSHRVGTARDELAQRIMSALEADIDRSGAAVITRLATAFDQLHGELDPSYQPDWSGLVSLIRLSGPAR